jgi:hypothetical protein
MVAEDYFVFPIFKEFCKVYIYIIKGLEAFYLFL